MEAMESAPAGPTANIMLMNIAMPVACGIAHQRNDDLAAAELSAMTARRACVLVNALLPRVHAIATGADELVAALGAARGAHAGGVEFSDDYINSWSSILQNFGYDDEQLAAIETALAGLAGRSSES